MQDRSNNQGNMDQLLEIMKRLRKECPWDAKQTHESLKRFLIEEAYEVLDSIDTESWDELSGELGDLLLQIVFHSEIASENGLFKFDDVVNKISNKLVNRHPHVFSDKSLNTAKEVQQNWEQTKVENEDRTSLLEGIPSSAPALIKAQRLQDKAASVGFDWPEISPVFEKVEEEFQELMQAYRSKDNDKIKNEFGDLIFAMVNLGRFMKIDAENALNLSNKKFVRRFNFIEKKYNNNVSEMKKASLEEMDTFWNEAKKYE